jgi:hypothetical protein
LNPRHPMGELDFEICPDQRHRQPQTKTNREKQLSPTLAFVGLCRLLSVALSQFLHSLGLSLARRFRFNVFNSKTPARIDQARLPRPDRFDSHTFPLTTNQVPRSKSRTLQSFFGTVQGLCK